MADEGGVTTFQNFSTYVLIATHQDQEGIICKDNNVEKLNAQEGEFFCFTRTGTISSSTRVVIIRLFSSRFQSRSFRSRVRTNKEDY